jgi:hypothetical protein
MTSKKLRLAVDNTLAPGAALRLIGSEPDPAA